MSQNEHISPFVNYAKLSSFTGKQVRLICKLKNVSTVKAPYRNSGLI